MSKPLSLTRDGTTYNLTLMSGEGKGKSFNLVAGKVTAGRGRENDIVILDDPQVSCKHALFVQTPSGLKVSNVSGHNQLLVNGHKVDSVVILEGDVITIGTTEIKVTFDHTQVQATRPSVSLAKENFPQPEIKTSMEETNRAVAVNLPDRPALRVADPPPPPMPQLQPSYEPPKKDRHANQQRKRRKKPSSNKTLFIAVFLLLIIYLILSPSKKPKDPLVLRTAEEVAKETEQATKAREMQEKELEEKGPSKAAQAYFIKGRRDYRVGQYVRALQSFEAALAIDPEHALATRYRKLTKVKIDREVEFNMIQGRRYRRKNQFRLCVAAFTNVLNIKKDPTDPIFKEAYAKSMECEALQQGRY